MKIIDADAVKTEVEASRKNKNGKGWTIKLKDPAPKVTKPGQWKDNEVVGMRTMIWIQ